MSQIKFEDQHRIFIQMLDEYLSRPKIGSQLMSWLTNTIMSESEFSSRLGPDSLTQYLEIRGITANPDQWLQACMVVRNLMTEYARRCVVSPILPEGYRTWKGGRRPVDAFCQVSVQLRNGSYRIGEAGEWTWKHANQPIDIIAYKVQQ